MSYQAFSNKNIRHFFYYFWLCTFILFQVVLQYFFNINLAVGFADNFTFLSTLIAAVVIANYGDYITRVKEYQFIPAFLILAFLSAVSVTVSAVLLYYFNSTASAYREFLMTSLPYRFLYAWFIVSGFSFMNYVWHKGYARTTLQKRDDDLREMAKDAELHKLYQQLQPHFLFNSLNSITTLIDSRPQQAKNMTQNLSDFLRGSLRKVDTEHIPFQDEMAHLSIYLTLEKVRFGDRLQTELEISKNTAEAFIPPLLLQPLIENAIKFGLYGTLGQVVIRLNIKCSDHFLSITISNPYDADIQPPKGTGFGLKSVKRRLYLIFGRQDLLQTFSQEESFITQLKIPQYDDKSYYNRR